MCELGRGKGFLLAQVCSKDRVQHPTNSKMKVHILTDCEKGVWGLERREEEY